MSPLQKYGLHHKCPAWMNDARETVGTCTCGLTDAIERERWRVGDPCEGGFYLVTVKNYIEPVIRFFDIYEHEWNKKEVDEKILAYRPLPSPWTPEERGRRMLGAYKGSAG